MVQRPNAIDQMRAITISREYGSGGGEIAQRLARQLGWKLVDHEIVVRVARRLGVSEQEAQVHDEHVEGFVSRLLRSMSYADPNMLLNPPVAPVTAEMEQHNYQEALSDVVEAAVEDGHTIIVGRGSQALLSAHRDVLHIRIVAPIAARVTYVQQREGLTQEQAEERIRTKDRDRLQYVHSAFNVQANDPYLYDLIINSAVLDLDSITNLIISALQDKAERLSVPVEQLGPGNGLSPYPGNPGDLHPPTV